MAHALCLLYAATSVPLSVFTATVKYSSWDHIYKVPKQHQGPPSPPHLLCLPECLPVQGPGRCHQVLLKGGAAGGQGLQL
jgi:hypothetical protein